MTRDEIERRARDLVNSPDFPDDTCGVGSANAAALMIAAFAVEMHDLACDEGIKMVDEGWELWEIKDQLRAKKLGGQR